jgi:hypothetical protein
VRQHNRSMAKGRGKNIELALGKKWKDPKEITG